MTITLRTKYEHLHHLTVIYSHRHDFISIQKNRHTLAGMSVFCANKIIGL